MNYIKNIDTICILVNIENFETSAKNMLDYLEQEKNKCKVMSNEKSNYQYIINVGDMTFIIYPNGTKGYSYILRNDGYQINISQYKSKIKNFYPIQIRISSEFLWAKGIIKAWSDIYKWIELNFGKIIENKVFRIDLCLHTSEINFTSNFENIYKGKFKKRNVNYNGAEINCLYFGTRKGKNIFCRIYNKSLEIRETKSKYWFYNIWKNNNLNIENVWNLEFELKSEFLRELQLKTIEDVCNNLPNLWRYCTCQWLLKVDRIKTRIERCPINSQWQEIQKAYDEFNSKGFIARKKQISLDAEILIPSIVGNITSYCARKNNINIEEAFKILYKGTKRYLTNKETDFKSEVLNKRKLIETNTNKTYEKEG